MLPSLLITLPSSSHEISSILQEDPFEIFTSSLSLISPDAAPNEHGIPGGRVLYQSSAFGKIELELADPETKRERDLFAHYVWNASMLFGELIGGRRGGLKEWREASVEARESADGEDRDRRVDDMLQRAFEEYDWSVAGESVLELGAGSGLVSIISILAGAACVTVTDYPLTAIIGPIQKNVSSNITSERLAALKISYPPEFETLGHAWGSNELFRLEPHGESFLALHASEQEHRYSRVVASDTLWLSGQHENLVKSIDRFLALHSTVGYTEPVAWIIAGFHTGRAKVAGFFEDVETFESGDGQGRRLAVDKRWEVDINGIVRPWNPERKEGIAERGRWCVVAVLKRKIP